MFSVKFSTSRSILIRGDLSKVFSTVANFRTWPHWSPWLCQEPESKVKVDGTPGGVGHSQTWEGQRIGSGRIKIASIDNLRSILFDLDFLKPWKSHSQAKFEFAAEGDDVRVTWLMFGSLPFFMFFLKKMMIAMIGRDFHRGLLMLKDYCEEGQVLSQVKVNGVKPQTGFYYVGLRRQCLLQELGAKMRDDFQKLGELNQSGRVPKPDSMLTLYHEFDIVKGICTYTAALAYHKRPEGPTDATLLEGSLPPHLGFSINHIGSYKHLGNGWSTAMGCQRYFKHKAKPAVPMYEIYHNMPGQVPERELLTEILLPIEGQTDQTAAS